MSTDKKAHSVEPRISMDDIKHQAENVKSKALAEAKGAVNTVLGDDVRTLLIVAGVVVVAASIAFFLGSRSSGSTMDQMFGE